MAFKDLNAHQRITTVHLDFMKHPDFSRLAGLTQIGKVLVGTSVPTAATDGCDVHYGEAFVNVMTREQLRYLVAHENMHKGLHHCTEYKHLNEKYPDLSNMAMDYVVNGMIEEMDPDLKFVNRPTAIPPLVDPKFAGLSFPEVLLKLLDEQKQQEKDNKDGKGKPQAGSGRGKPMDVHIQRAPDGKDGKDGSGQPGDDPGDGPGLSAAALKKQVGDAINQGVIVSNKLRGVGGGGTALGGFQERQTDWRTPLRAFVQELCEGDDQSRFSPPNKRMLPLGIILPSHFSEATGELIVACDTSGSMHGLYPVVFGEIARICQHANPAAVRVIWWGDHVEGEQLFKPTDYPYLAKLMQPMGGGGTTVSCVARYVRDKKYKPRAVIYLTDGYVEAQYEVVSGPVLWGVVDHANWVPLRGKAIHISSLGV